MKNNSEQQQQKLLLTKYMQLVIKLMTLSRVDLTLYLYWHIFWYFLQFPFSFYLVLFNTNHILLHNGYMHSAYSTIIAAFLQKKKCINKYELWVFSDVDNKKIDRNKWIIVIFESALCSSESYIIMDNWRSISLVYFHFFLF